jgi:hypothetical protein
MAVEMLHVNESRHLVQAPYPQFVPTMHSSKQISRSG